MRGALALAVVVAAGVLVPGAAADGLPVLGVDVGSDGVTTSSGPERYLTIPDGPITIVEGIQRNGGRLLGLARLHGSFTIPAVAYDSTAAGLSADGRRLVLIEPRQSFPRSATTFAVLDVPRLRLTRVIELHGDFSFDALSPDGSTMFLIQYTSPADPNRYAVRAYDLVSGRLLAKPIVDPRERGEEMRGKPVTRTTSADGRWAYTLYDGGGAKPFVHALDTVARTAHCVDLPALRGRRDLWQLRITRADAGRTLRIGDLVSISTSDFSVDVPRAARNRAPARVAALAGGSAFLVVAVAGWALFRRPRRSQEEIVKGP
ncbi:MAG: hypothetical protein ACJ76I_08145 [Gaiellaceae bacterium]